MDADTPTTGTWQDGVAVTVTVVTRNRQVELARALESITRQEGAVEVVVIDDASTDQTSQMVADRFPGVRLVRREQPQSLVQNRNLAMATASGAVVVFLDDDAWFPSPLTVLQTVGDFDDPRIGAVSIPFTDVEGEQRTLRQAAPAGPGVWLTPTFIGAAHAVRADAFREVGGYRPEPPIYFDESGFSLRLLDAGYVVRLGRADPAVHEPSKIRSLRRMDVLGRRNEIVWVWSSFPAPWHVAYVLGYMAKGMRYGIRVRRLWAMLDGMLQGLRALPGLDREPVSRRAFRIDRRLRRAKSLPLSTIADDLPPREGRS